ncbi:hypothetical protein LTR36_005001 [Oleoguttula mirabilis]|uniref:DUF7730 domain-containing protein n=1 Tax=Oleoguttula mirabilis TaxID=1507867 RepID=A0AAV9JYI6_9PEZI|nr:hypothetical protein LTR36_005001 [Oleoguttula mirabilis]
MSSTQTVKERIEAVISPWAESKTKPPFTEEQLVTMALASNSKPMTKKEVFMFVVGSLRYFQQQALEAFYNEPEDGWNHFVSQQENFRTILNAVYSRYGLPLERLSGGMYNVSAPTSERLLQTLLDRGGDEKKKTKTFPFFKLPAELRNTIYESVFQYPKAGLMFRSIGRKRAPHVEVLPMSQVEADVGDEVTEAQPLLLAPFPEILSPLLVSHQFRQEAEAYFYIINSFRFVCLTDLDHFLTRVPEEHKQHIQHIDITFQRWESRYCPGLFLQLTKLGGLRKLDIRIDEGAWTQTVTRSTKKDQSVTNMPGLTTLGKIRGLEQVTFHGCPTLENLLKDDMLKPKPVKKGAGGGKKRKAADGGEAAATKKGGRTKKAKV